MDTARPTAPARLTTVTLIVAGMLTTMAPNFVAPALPAISRAFAQEAGVDVLVPLILTLPALVVAVAAPLVGFALDRTEPRGVLLAGTCLYAIAGSSGAIAQSLPQLLSGRLGLGLAVAATMTSVTTLITRLYVDELRERMIALFSSAMGLGGTTFTALGGFAAEVGWRWAFLMYGAAIPVLVFAYIGIPRVSTGGHDVAWEPPIAPIAPGSASGVANDRTAEPHGRFRSLADRVPPAVVAGLATILASQVVFYLVPVHLPYVLEEQMGVGAVTSGLGVGTVLLAFASSSMLTPQLTSGWRRTDVLLLGTILITLGYGTIAGAPDLVVMAPGLLLSGIGLGAVVPTAFSIVAAAAPVGFRGRTMGLATSSLFLGQFASPLVWQPLVLRTGRQAGFLAAAGAVAVVAIGLKVRSRRVGATA